jgi:hypothetical protein
MKKAVKIALSALYFMMGAVLLLVGSVLLDLLSGRALFFESSGWGAYAAIGLLGGLAGLAVGMRMRRLQASLQLLNERANLLEVQIGQGGSAAQGEESDSDNESAEESAAENRESFEEHCRVEWNRSIRSKKPISLVLFRYDVYDESALEWDAATVKEGIIQIIQDIARRPTDWLANYSDNVIALLMPDTSIEGGSLVVQTLWSKLSGLRVESPGYPEGLPVGVNMCLLSKVPEWGLEASAFLRTAETGLEKACQDGAIIVKTQMD